MSTLFGQDFHKGGVFTVPKGRKISLIYIHDYVRGLEQAITVKEGQSLQIEPGKIVQWIVDDADLLEMG